MGYGLPQATGREFYDIAQGHMNTALGAAGTGRPNSKTEISGPGKTAGGALMSGVGAGMAGQSILGSTGVGMTMGGFGGAAIGAGIGILSYFFS